MVNIHLFLSGSRFEVFYVFIIKPHYFVSKFYCVYIFLFIGWNNESIKISLNWEVSNLLILDSLIIGKNSFMQPCTIISISIMDFYLDLRNNWTINPHYHTKSKIWNFSCRFILIFTNINFPNLNYLALSFL